jgi:AraC-like DNA-binding protein
VTVLVDTLQRAPAERFDYWHEAASRTFFPLQIERKQRTPFYGRVLGHTVGPLEIFRISGDPNTCLRTPRGVAAADPEVLQLYVVRRGNLRFGQQGRTSVLRPSDLTTQDTSHPFVIDVGERFELVVVNFPKFLLGARADRIAASSALRIPGDSGLGGRIGTFLVSIADGLDDGSVIGDAYLADGMVGLLGSLFHDDGAPVDGMGSSLIDRIRAYVEAHLHEPSLGPEQIAAAHFISVRYLHKLFRSEETTVSRWIQQRRLERCRRDLGDPALAGRTIEAVAARCGLVNPDHLSRLFRATYGCTPREMRQRLLGVHPAAGGVRGDCGARPRPGAP